MSSKGSRKRAPDRGIWDISHRWIYYQGFYFERLSRGDVYDKSLVDSDRCSYEMESVPAGYSKLSIDCIQKCTNRYKQEYGGYSLLRNNCHKFANRLSAILCNSVTCPSWCRRDGYPYYFGTTNLICMSSKGKRAPDRGLWDISHRWIYYQGFYFERLSDRDVYGTSLTDSDKCSHQMESVPAGYSKLSVDCIQKCTNRYRQKYGGYSLLSNNCHKFANRLSAILCDSVTCPSWCY
ncbi:hypothetical protein KUTeg_023793 [Tegillarca granosa]|uniref:WSC domain-containing protein n=1 Tax=Tegillarca granosa TaxID=220873 RepID=A0ABQ9E2R8_TEGGR|nr:hypothetical protein KUTeg_023793 [Tegillarca granosa]